RLGAMTTAPASAGTSTSESTTMPTRTSPPLGVASVISPEGTPNTRTDDPSSRPTVLLKYAVSRVPGDPLVTHHIPAASNSSTTQPTVTQVASRFRKRLLMVISYRLRKPPGWARPAAARIPAGSP